MAEINIEDCYKYVNNRFDLVLIASQRGKELNHGVSPLINDTKEKEAIISLKEIASGKITNIENLQKAIVGKALIKTQEEYSQIHKHLDDNTISKDLEKVEYIKDTIDKTKSSLFEDQMIIEEE
jgi:DNA-directed RNA polymerase subunit omega